MMQPGGLTMWQLILAGGPMMWPIAVCSVVVMAIIAGKIAYFNSIQLHSRQFLGILLDKMKRHQIKEAIEICDSSKAPLSHILKAGILKYDRSKPQIKEALEDASLYEIPKLEKDLDTLSTIAQVCPLLGIIGTAMGMMKMFYGMQSRLAVSVPLASLEVAQGVWQALLCTVAGLMVATLSYVAYNYFVSRVNKTVLEMETMATEFVNFLTEQ